MVEKKIVMWCGDAPNHKALANKLHQAFGLTAIVVDQKKGKTKKKKDPLLTRMIDRLQFKPLYDAWKQMQQYYQAGFSEWPPVPVHFTPSINTEDSFEFTGSMEPDLVIVSGTAMVKGRMLGTRASIGIINLHTGLSPYVKGGPNCTNWCIANNDWHLVGNTIMWINAGIDSGNIITNETVDIRECKDLTEVQLKVMEQAHDLYLRSVAYLMSTEPPYVSIPQSDLGTGKLFLTKQWTAEKRAQLLKNWKNRKKSFQVPPPVTIPLNH